MALLWFVTEHKNIVASQMSAIEFSTFFDYMETT